MGLLLLLIHFFRLNFFGENQSETKNNFLYQFW